MVAALAPMSSSTSGEVFPTENEVVEVSLLLPRWQIQAMEQVARKRGMNLGQMLRSMIGATFAPQKSSAS